MTSYILSGSFGSGRGLWFGPPAEHGSGGVRNDSLETRVARLEVIAEHTQRDISELKTDVRDLRKEMKEEIGGLRTQMDEQGSALRTQIDGQGSALRTQIDGQGSALRTEMGGQGSTLRAEMAALGSALRAEIGALRTEVRTDFRVMFGALVTVALGLAGLMAKGFGWY